MGPVRWGEPMGADMGRWQHSGPSCDWPPPSEWTDIYRRHRWRAPWDPDQDPCASLERARRGCDEQTQRMRLETMEARAHRLREHLERVESDIESLTPQPGPAGRS